MATRPARFPGSPAEAVTEQPTLTRWMRMVNVHCLKGRAASAASGFFLCLSLAAVSAGASSNDPPAERTVASSSKTADAVSEYARQLSDNDKFVRREAAYQLSLLGADARAALPELIKALEDREQQVWFGAVMTIAQIGPDAKDAIPALIRGLGRRAQREKRQVWYRSSYALGQIGAAAVPALTEALGSDEAMVRAGAAQALGWIGADAEPAVPALISLLNDDNEEARRLAGETIAKIGSAALPQLLPLLSAPEARVREESARTLGYFKEAAASHVPRVLEQLAAESEPNVRAAQIACLSSLGCDEPQFVQRVVRELCGSDEGVRHAAVNTLVAWSADVTVPEMKRLLTGENALAKERAAWVLERLGSRAVGAIPELVDAAADAGEAGSPWARALTAVGRPAVQPLLGVAEREPVNTIQENHWVVRCLAGMGPLVVPALVDTLDRTSPAVRLVALESLRLMEREASPAIPAISKLLKAEPARVRARALAALLAATSQPSTILTEIQTALSDSDPAVRASAAEAIIELGPAGEPCVPLLIPGLRDPEPTVRLSSAKALAALGDKAKPATEELTAQLGSSDPKFRIAVIDALGRIGAGAASATPILIQLLEPALPAEKTAVLQALARFGTEASEATTAALALAGHSDPKVRSAALGTLSQIAKDPETVLPLLGAGLDDPESTVRTAAVEGLGRLGEKAQPYAARLFAMLENQAERPAALESLRRIKSPSVPHYIEALKNEDPAVRLFACESLGALGPSAEEAIPALREATRDSYDAVRRRARAAIRSIEGRNNDS